MYSKHSRAASSLVRSTGSVISDMLNNFDEFHQKACDWASQVDINASLPSVRIRRRKLQPGETATEQLMTDPLLRFKVEYFYPIVDVCVIQLHDRFEDFHNYASKFAVLLWLVYF